MAAIPLPESGQPMDVNFIYSIVQELNNLNNIIASNNKSLSQVRDKDNILTSSLVVCALEIDGPTGNKPAGTISPIEANFSTVKFSSPPIVLVSVVAQDQSAASKNIIAFIKGNTTQSKCSIELRHNEAGIANVKVHVLAIGVSI